MSSEKILWFKMLEFDFSLWNIVPTALHGGRIREYTRELGAEKFHLFAAISQQNCWIIHSLKREQAFFLTLFRNLLALHVPSALHLKWIIVMQLYCGGKTTLQKWDVLCKIPVTWSQEFSVILKCVKMRRDNWQRIIDDYFVANDTMNIANLSSSLLQNTSLDFLQKKFS
jgi:hypothetical protein